MESHFFHDKGWQLHGWEYLAPPNGEAPYCSKSMHAYSTWRGHLVAAEKELLHHCEANSLDRCPEALTQELLDNLPQVKHFFSKGEGEADGARAEGTNGAPAAATGEPSAGAPVSSDADKKKGKAKVAPKDLSWMIANLEHILGSEPEPGCRRPYGTEPGFCNSTVQQTCCRPVTCECPTRVDLTELNLTKRQVAVAAQCS